MRTVTLPSGIGDILWVMQKLVHTGEKFDFVIPDSSPQRGHQIFELMPYMTRSFQYQSGLSYRKIAAENSLNWLQDWKSLSFYRHLVLSANPLLEAGRRIEGLIVDLPTSYKIELETQKGEAFAKDFIKGPSIGIYTSAYSNARHTHYNGWGQQEWSSFIQMVHQRLPGYQFILIGAKYDQDLSFMVSRELERMGIGYKFLIGESLDKVVEVLKRLKYFVGFPSGLSILNELIGQDGLMFYGPHIAGIMGGWADPKRLAGRRIIESQFTAPENVVTRLENLRIFERIAS